MVTGEFLPFDAPGSATPPGSPTNINTRARVFRSTKFGRSISALTFRLWAGSRDLELHFAGLE
jgi:hypothetical protein